MPTTAAAMNEMGSVARYGTPRRVIATTHAYPPTIAKAPCARLMKFISPIVTDRPILMTNSSAPYATPSKRIPSRLITASCTRLRRLTWVLHVLKLVELDVPELVVPFFDAAHVDRLHDVARF